ncbi:hypothetical protein OY671_001527 [Metschnikowia pulcherrima]|nr:hypothetical protein OY671_001527 [Metschnikowia pulcherrima]
MRFRILASILIGAQISTAAPLSVTTSENNIIADILGGLKGTSTNTGLAGATTTDILAANTATVISGLDQVATNTLAVDATTPAVTTAATSISSDGDLANILSELAGSKTAPAMSISTGTSTLAYESATTSATKSSSSTATNSSSGILNLFLTVVEFLAKSFGVSDKVVSTVEEVIDGLDGDNTASATAAVTSTNQA